MAATQHPDIDSPGLAAAIEALSEQQINNLPYGAIRLDETGRVVFYNDTERQQSGLRKEVLGRNFFTEIAPCLNTPRYRGRIDEALQAGRLDVAFDEIADLPNGQADVPMHVRVLANQGGGCWIFMQCEP
jgi:photoactive yellow protein